MCCCLPAVQAWAHFEHTQFATSHVMLRLTLSWEGGASLMTCWASWLHSLMNRMLNGCQKNGTHCTDNHNEWYRDGAMYPSPNTNTWLCTMQVLI